MIAVVLPTRGYVYTQVQAAIEKMRHGPNIIKVFYSHDKGLPEAQNYLVEQALKEKPSHILFIEEDTVPPPSALQNLLDAKADIACIDYAVNGHSCVARNKVTNEILWCGFGCTLVNRNVLEELPKPWFRTDKTLRLNDWQWIDTPAKYGGQDIWFCMKARENGFLIKQVRGECNHLMTVVQGATGTNNGTHHIASRERIIHKQVIDVPESYGTIERAVI